MPRSGTRSWSPRRTCGATAGGPSTGWPTTSRGWRTTRCSRPRRPARSRRCFHEMHGGAPVLRGSSRRSRQDRDAGTTHWQSPGFFGYFPANASPPAILGELVAAGLGINGMLWTTSPACTEIEMVMLDWLVELLGLPARFRSEGQGGGVIRTARRPPPCPRCSPARRACDRVRRRTPQALRLHLVEAHSSVQSARVAGFTRSTFASSRWTKPSGSTRRRWRRQWAPTGTPASCRAAWSQPPGRRPRWASTPSAPWASCAASKEPGCASTPPWLGRRRFARSCGRITTASSWPTARVQSAQMAAHQLRLRLPLCRRPGQPHGRAVGHARVSPQRGQCQRLGCRCHELAAGYGRRFRALKLWWVLRSYGAEGLRRRVREGVQLWRRGPRGWWPRTLVGVVCSAGVEPDLLPPRRRGQDGTERLLTDLNATGDISSRAEARRALCDPLLHRWHLDGGASRKGSLGPHRPAGAGAAPVA